MTRERLCEWEIRRLDDWEDGMTRRLRDWKKKDELFDLFINFKLFNFLPLPITPKLLNFSTTQL